MVENTNIVILLKVTRGIIKQDWLRPVSRFPEELVLEPGLLSTVRNGP
jgi:hypothetical protein